MANDTGKSNDVCKCEALHVLVTSPSQSANRLSELEKTDQVVSSGPAMLRSANRLSEFVETDPDFGLGVADDLFLLLDYESDDNFHPTMLQPFYKYVSLLQLEKGVLTQASAAVRSHRSCSTAVSPILCCRLLSFLAPIELLLSWVDNSYVAI